MIVMGWDVGGAHLKAARLEAGRVTGATAIACPLWQGLQHLDAAFSQARQELGEADLHAVTMTGELSDIFAGRAEGVAGLAERVAATLPGTILFYGSRLGWLGAAAASANVGAVASANWHATAAWLAETRGEAVLVDIGSTTTDIVPVCGKNVSARGASDGERLAAGELVYTGATRTFLMAVAQKAPFRGAWTPVMNEYFASTADVYRILRVLPEDADRLPAADGRAKTPEASCARLARMIGRDAAEAEDWEWRQLAQYFAEAQLRSIEDAAMQVFSASPLADDAPIVGAGVGQFAARKLAARLGRPFEAWADTIPVVPGAASIAGDCAPAVAVALLLAAAQGSPP